MDDRIEVAELNKHRLFLASPQYGGQCNSIFARSLADLAYAFGRYQILLDTCFFTNESLVTRARNHCVSLFLQSPSDHLLFVDADIGFKAHDAMQLFILQIQNPDYEIIGGAYPRKDIGAGVVVNWDGEVDFGSKSPVEVNGLGTGFMLIHRKVFEKMDVAFPEFRYKTDDAKPPFNGVEVMQYFQAAIDLKSRRYFSEDYWFSARCKEIGIRTWLCPWMKLRHAGTYIFE